LKSKLPERNFYTFTATLLGAGFFPGAPGTAGTVVAAVLYFLIPEVYFNKFLPGIPILILFTLITVHITGKAEKGMKKDDSRIVLDEFSGFFFAVLFLPKKLVILIIAFILFRIFDIFKPEPVRSLQRLGSGWGIVADDVMAAIYANICLQILIRIIPDLIN